ncbi:hypothetical protein B566_EDAN011963 [Ephemera danica]|nr:hypothetical protein B566_EDAN011963 [Ephemera danica]
MKGNNQSTWPARFPEGPEPTPCTPLLPANPPSTLPSPVPEFGMLGIGPFRTPTPVLPSDTPPGPTPAEPAADGPPPTPPINDPPPPDSFNNDESNFPGPKSLGPDGEAPPLCLEREKQEPILILLDVFLKS